MAPLRPAPRPAVPQGGGVTRKPNPLGPLWDVPRATRAEALAKAERAGPRHRRLLLAAFAEGPATADEAGARVGLQPLQCRPVVTRLHDAGQLETTGEIRPSALGNPSAVYRLSTPNVTD